MGKDHAINSAQKQLSVMQEKIHQLELENTELKGEKKVLIEDEKNQSNSEDHTNGIFKRVTNKISTVTP